MDEMKVLHAERFLHASTGQQGMFPYRDEQGAVSLKLVRDAIKAIPGAEGVDAATKKRLQTKARRILMQQSSRKALSFSDIGEQVRGAIYAASPEGQRRAAEGYEDRDWWYTEEIFPGYAIVRTKAGYYKVPYTINSETGAVSLAAMTEWKLVKQEWVEVSA